MLPKGHFDVSITGIDEITNKSAAESNIIQITKGELVSKMSGYSGDFSLSVHRTVSASLSSYGFLPSFISAFGFSLDNRPILLNGNEINRSTISFLDSGDAFALHTPAQHANLAFLVNEQKIKSFLYEDDLYAYDRLKRNLAMRFIDAPIASTKIASLMIQFIESCCSSSDKVINSLAAKDYEYSVISALLEANQDCPEKVFRLNNKSRVVIRAMEYIEGCDLNTTAINDVAKKINTSLRNLEISFRAILYVTPKQYLVACRLNAIRQNLLRCDPSKTLKSVVQSYGVVHMGHFTKAYTAHFGEPPLVTLNKSWCPAKKNAIAG